MHTQVKEPRTTAAPQYTPDDFEEKVYAHWPREMRVAMKNLRPAIRSLLDSDLGLPYGPKTKNKGLMN